MTFDSTTQLTVPHYVEFFLADGSRAPEGPSFMLVPKLPVRRHRVRRSRRLASYSFAN